MTKNPTQKHKTPAFSEATGVLSPGVGSTQTMKHEQEQADTADAMVRSKDKKAGSIRDKWWLWGFLIHTIAYLGCSAYINYLAITVAQPQNTEATSSPITG